MTTMTLCFENSYIDKMLSNLRTAFAVTLPKEAAKAAHNL